MYSSIRVGQQYGRLTVVKKADSIVYRCGTKKTAWLCACECGSEKVILGVLLIHNKARSCGCLRRETAQRLRTLHGQSRIGSRTKEYRAWQSLKQRCLNKKTKGFARYGGRGISVCERWLSSFDAFFADMGPAPDGTSLDRWPDPDGPYEPHNCRWATSEDQANNMCRNVFLEYNGLRMTASQWARKIGIAPKTLHGRIAAGWTTERVLTTPAEKRVPKLLLFNGQPRSIAAWARILGMGPEVIRSRLQRGWSVERALSTSVG